MKSRKDTLYENENESFAPMSSIQTELEAERQNENGSASLMLCYLLSLSFKASLHPLRQIVANKDFDPAVKQKLA